jgi:DNA-directed RNA polymerase subunit RPC12/RpoP
MLVGYCPECDGEISFRYEPQEGKKINCPHCAAYLVVIGLHPIELDWVFADEQFIVGEEKFDT